MYTVDSCTNVPDQQSNNVITWLHATRSTRISAARLQCCWVLVRNLPYKICQWYACVGRVPAFASLFEHDVAYPLELAPDVYSTTGCSLSVHYQHDLYNHLMEFSDIYLQTLDWDVVFE
jgi:hypothetical protein